MILVVIHVVVVVVVDDGAYILCDFDEILSVDKTDTTKISLLILLSLTRLQNRLRHSLF